MLHLITRAKNEICQRPKRLFAHLFVLGVATLQFGCANIHSYSSEPSLPPETQAAILNGIRQTTSGQPFRFMEIEKFNGMMKYLKETRAEILGYSSKKHSVTDLATFEKDLATRAEELGQYIKDNSSDVLNVGRQADDGEWTQKVDYVGLLGVSDHIDGDTGPLAFSLDKESGGMQLLVVENIANPLEPTSVEKNLFSNSCGLPILDKVLGPKLWPSLRAYILWHEAQHIADTRDLVGEVRKLGELREHESELQVLPLKKEIFADVESLEKFCKITGDKEFLMTIKHLRALSVVIAGDPKHATAFEIEKVLKKVGAGDEDYPEMTAEETYKAVAKLGRAQGSFSVQNSFWKTEGTIREEYVEFRYKELVDFRQGKNLTSFQETQLADPNVQNVLEAADKALQFFHQKLQKVGQKMPVALPDIKLVSRSDVKGVSGRNLSAGVKPRNE